VKAFSVDKQNVQDTGLTTLGTALVSAGVALATSANGDVNQMLTGLGLSLLGILAYYIKYNVRDETSVA